MSQRISENFTLMGQLRLCLFFNQCVVCSKRGCWKKCSRCKALPYCSRECQQKHWKTHKKDCKKPGSTDDKKTTPKEEVVSLVVDKANNYLE